MATDDMMMGMAMMDTVVALHDNMMLTTKKQFARTCWNFLLARGKYVPMPRLFRHDVSNYIQ